MAKIHIENGIISSSADYGLYHGTSEIAKVEAGGFRVQGDIIAENLSSSRTFMTNHLVVVLHDLVILRYPSI